MTNISEKTDKKFYSVVGVNDLEGTTFARCTTPEKAEKAKKLLEEQGFEDMLTIIQDNIGIDELCINGSIIKL